MSAEQRSFRRRESGGRRQNGIKTTLPSVPWTI